jgi:hypothetical protein
VSFQLVGIALQRAILFLCMVPLAPLLSHSGADWFIASLHDHIFLETVNSAFSSCVVLLKVYKNTPNSK